MLGSELPSFPSGPHPAERHAQSGTGPSSYPLRKATVITGDPCSSLWPSSSCLARSQCRAKELPVKATPTAVETVASAMSRRAGRIIDGGPRCGRREHPCRDPHGTPTTGGGSLHRAGALAARAWRHCLRDHGRQPAGRCSSASCGTAASPTRCAGTASRSPRLFTFTAGIRVMSAVRSLR